MLAAMHTDLLPVVEVGGTKLAVHVPDFEAVMLAAGARSAASVAAEPAAAAASGAASASPVDAQQQAEKGFAPPGTVFELFSAQQRGSSLPVEPMRVLCNRIPGVDISQAAWISLMAGCGSRRATAEERRLLKACQLLPDAMKYSLVSCASLVGMLRTPGLQKRIPQSARAAVARLADRLESLPKHPELGSNVTPAAAAVAAAASATAAGPAPEGDDADTATLRFGLDCGYGVQLVQPTILLQGLGQSRDGTGPHEHSACLHASRCIAYDFRFTSLQQCSRMHVSEAGS